MSLTNPEHLAVDDNPRKPFAVFTASGGFAGTFLEDEKSAKDPTPNRERRGTIDLIALEIKTSDGELHYPDKKISDLTIDDFAGQVDMLISQVEIPEQLLAIYSLTAQLKESDN